MSTINVVHRSRTVEYTINFTASGETSFGFSAVGTGQFFDVVLNNVASYTINGAAVTLPFNVTSGTRYTIAITKTTAGQTASITLKQRKQDNQQITLNAPDFGQFTGRYMYVLMNSGTEVRKIDTNLLVASNYQGAGVWTTNPVISTITLPTIPSGAVWTSLTFVKEGNVPRMILHTVDANTNQAHFCVIRLSDDLVFNIDFTTQNSYTTHTLQTNGNTATSAIYDFINEIVYFAFNQQAPQEHPVVSLNLATNVFTNYGTSNFTGVRMRAERNRIRPFKFIPDLQRWSYIGDFSLIENRFYNYKPFVNSGNLSSYQLSTGTTDRTSGQISTKVLLDNSGNVMSTLNASFIARFGVDEIFTMDSVGYIFSVEDNSYALHDYKSASPVHKALLGSNFDGSTNAYRSLIGSNLNVHFYARTNQNPSTPGNRIIVFNPALTTPEFAYLDLGAQINQIHTDQLVI
jgi:hypothetical protein